MASPTAHHFVWYSCLCVEAGSILPERDRGKWCDDRPAVRSFKERATRQCMAAVNADAAVIASFEEAHESHSAYLFNFVHLAFPRRKFATRQAARRFLKEALAADEPYDLLHPYLKESAQRIFSLFKDAGAGTEVDVAFKDEQDEHVFSGFLDSYGNP